MVLDVNENIDIKEQHMSNSETNDLLTVPESATFLRLRPSTIRAWILHRRVPYVKLGGRVCIRRADLETLINHSVVQALPNVRDGFKSAGTSPPRRAKDSNSRVASAASGGVL